MSGTGKTMIFAAWIGAAALLTWLFAGELDRRDNPNQEIETVRTEGATEVTLAQNRMGHYVANGQINGRSVRFLLDTGATNVAVGESLARDLGLERGPPSPTRTANGTITTYHTVLDSVRIGGIEIRDVNANINPRMDGDDVLLGMSFLRQLELIQRGDELLLRQGGT